MTPETKCSHEKRRGCHNLAGIVTQASGGKAMKAICFGTGGNFIARMGSYPFMRRDDVLKLPSMPLAGPSYPAGPYRFVNREL